MQAPENRVKRIQHPTAGLLRLDYTYLWLGQRLGTRIVSYTPADLFTPGPCLTDLYPLSWVTKVRNVTVAEAGSGKADLTLAAGRADARQYIFDSWRSVARHYAFREYDGPPLESLELFTTKSGDEIVGQLYNFVDKGQREIALRPEMTPTLARMIAAHERNYKKPVKWFALPQLFRYERQQKGRLREHFQLNADIFGETDRASDALQAGLPLTSGGLAIQLAESGEVLTSPKQPVA